MNGEDRSPVAGAVDKQMAEDEAARLATVQAERLAKRAAERAAAPAAPEMAPAPAADVPQLVAHITVSLFSNGQASVDAPVGRPDLCFAAMQGIMQTMLDHTRHAAAAQAVEQYKKLPFMKRAFPAARG